MQDKISIGMKNAISFAKRYIEIMPFSYQGLIEQLKFDGFTVKEAEYGVTAIEY